MLVIESGEMPMKGGSGCMPPHGCEKWSPSPGLLLPCVGNSGGPFVPLVALSSPKGSGADALADINILSVRMPRKSTASKKRRYLITGSFHIERSGKR